MTDSTVDGSPLRLQRALAFLLSVDPADAVDALTSAQWTYGLSETETERLSAIPTVRLGLFKQSLRRKRLENIAQVFRISMAVLNSTIGTQRAADEFWVQFPTPAARAPGDLHLEACREFLTYVRTQAEVRRRKPWLADLAGFEYARGELMFNAAPPSAAAARSPHPFAFDDHLVLDANARLLSTEWDVVALSIAHGVGGDLEATETHRRRLWLALSWRPGSGLRTFSVGPASYRLLERCAAGAPAESTTRGAGESDERLRAATTAMVRAGVLRVQSANTSPADA